MPTVHNSRPLNGVNQIKYDPGQQKLTNIPKSMLTDKFSFLGCIHVLEQIFESQGGNGSKTSNASSSGGIVGGGPGGNSGGNSPESSKSGNSNGVTPPPGVVITPPMNVSTINFN